MINLIQKQVLYLFIGVMLTLGSTLGAQDLIPPKVPIKSIFSLSAGYTSDYGDHKGWSLFIKSMSFLGKSPWYYGFGSTTGAVGTDSIFETSFLAGWNSSVGGTDLGLDACLNIVLFGGRVNGETMIFRAEAPAFQPMLGLSIPANASLDVQLTAAPLIRPYDLLNGRWDFSRSYLTFSFSLRFKNYLEAEILPWAQSE